MGLKQAGGSSSLSEQAACKLGNLLLTTTIPSDYTTTSPPGYCVALLAPNCLREEWVARALQQRIGRLQGSLRQAAGRLQGGRR